MQIPTGDGHNGSHNLVSMTVSKRAQFLRAIACISGARRKSPVRRHYFFDLLKPPNPSRHMHCADRAAWAKGV